MSVSRHRAVGLLRQRLRLNAAQHGRAAAFPAVGVRHLADDVLLATLAMCSSAPHRLLCVPVGMKSAASLPSIGGNALLQRVDGGVVAEHVVAYLGRGHRGAHRRRSVS